MKIIIAIIISINLCTRFIYCGEHPQNELQSFEQNGDNKVLFTTRLDKGYIRKIRCDNQNNVFIAFSGEEANVCRTINGKRIYSLHVEIGTKLSQCVFSHNGKYLATISSVPKNEPGSPHGNFFDDEVSFSVWNAIDGALIRQYVFNQYQSFSNICFSFDDQKVLLNNLGKIQTYDFHSGKLIQENRHDASLGAFSPQGNYSLVYKWNRPENIRLTVWSIQKDSLTFDLETGMDTRGTFTMPNLENAVSISYDESVLAFLDQVHSLIRVWELKTGHPEKTLHVSGMETNCGCLSPTGKYYAVGSKTGQISIWEVNSGNVVHSFNEYPDNISSMAWTFDEGHLLCGYANGTIIALTVSIPK